MKKTLIALMALAGVACAVDYTGASKITLDSGYGNAETSAYEALIKGETLSNNNGALRYTSAEDSIKTITFYINVNDLVGGEALKDGWTYYLDSFSFVKEEDNGYYTGGNRTLTLSNGSESVIFSEASSSSKYVTTNFESQVNESKSLLSFEKGDMLTITLTAGVGERIDVRYYDINSPGVSFTMNNGQVNDGDDHTINPGNTNWKYNSPVIRLTAYAVPEPATATLSLLALAGLAARRRRH